MKAFQIKTFLLLSLFVSFLLSSSAQIKNDTLTINSDSVHVTSDSQNIKKNSLQVHDSIKLNKIQTITFDSLLKQNKYLNFSSPPVSFIIKAKKLTGKDFLFYLVGTFILLLAIFKIFYAKYFNNIFKVFFNTSLRQNQLTDLLLQAKLPSLIFNLFFAISAGIYAWLLLNHYHLLKNGDNYIFIPLSILAIAVIYLGKYLSLKFIGWITGMSAFANQYIFVIFLINKITCIVLIPFIVFLAFGRPEWTNTIIISSFLILGLLFLLRWLRTFSLLQNQLKINRLHFLLYITGVEILPIVIIYKLILQVLMSS